MTGDTARVDLATWLGMESGNYSHYFNGLMV